MEMPWIPEHFVRPEFGKEKCWFKSEYKRKKKLNI